MNVDQILDIIREATIEKAEINQSIGDFAHAVANKTLEHEVFQSLDITQKEKLKMAVFIIVIFDTY